MEELREKGAILKISKFTTGKKQLHVKDVDESRQLAHVFIHVERKSKYQNGDSVKGKPR